MTAGGCLGMGNPKKRDDEREAVIRLAESIVECGNDLPLHFPGSSAVRALRDLAERILALNEQGTLQ